MSKEFVIKGSGEYDVGIPGVWSFPNYGTALTQYSLYKFIKSYGLKVLMIERPTCAPLPPTGKLDLFETVPYNLNELAPLYPNLKSMYSANDHCKMFIIGSDQMFNNYLYNAFGRFIILDWVRANKKKVGYACSFGFDFIFGTEFDRAEMHRCINLFHAFSVRELSGIQLLKNEFNLNVDCVLDPVFMCDPDIFIKMCFNASNIPKWENRKYIFAYIIDPNDEKEKILKQLEIEYGLSVCAVSDAEFDLETIQSKWDFPTLPRISVEQWLKLMKNAEFIVTDSFHGTAFSLIFQKQFITIPNLKRGRTRFESLLTIVNLTDRIVEESKNICHCFDRYIDYFDVNHILNEKRKYSKLWFENAVFEDQNKRPFSDYDAINVRCDWIEDDLIKRIHMLKQEHDESLRLLDDKCTKLSLKLDSLIQYIELQKSHREELENRITALTEKLAE